MEGGVNMESATIIDMFKYNNGFLSNFLILTYPIRWGGLEYKSSEHFYQAMKTINHEDRMWIASLGGAWEAKKAGGPFGYKGRRIVKRPDFDDIRIRIMRIAVLMKFANNPVIATKLINTGNKMLIEGNTWHDNFWGNCTCSKCSNKRGENWLGQILMETRNALTTIGY